MRQPWPWEIQKIVVDKIIEGGLQSIDYWQGW
jgi:hypothetical protein